MRARPTIAAMKFFMLPKPPHTERPRGSPPLHAVENLRPDRRGAYLDDEGRSVAVRKLADGTSPARSRPVCPRSPASTETSAHNRDDHRPPVDPGVSALQTTSRWATCRRGRSS